MQRISDKVSQTGAKSQIYRKNKLRLFYITNTGEQQLRITNKIKFRPNLKKMAKKTNCLS